MSTSRRSGDLAAAALRAIWSRKIVVAVSALAVCAAVVLIESFRGHEYTSEALVQVRGVEAMESSGEWLPGILNELDARGISRQAADSAGWSGGQEGFDQRLELEPSGDGELKIGFSAPQAEMSAQGANAYAAAFVEEMRSMSGDRLAGGALGAEASLERSARAPEVPARRPFVLGLAALAPGLAAGAAAALALARRDRHWRDAEFALGAPVLGVIPEREPASHGKESAVDGKL